MSDSPFRYEAHGGALLRLTTDASGLTVPADLDLADPDGMTAVKAWLSSLWQRADVRDALEAASPVLCRQIAGIASGQEVPARRLRRAALSVASYLLRWQGRPTPFGLFAGVTAAAIGDPPRVRHGVRHRTLVRADAEWLADVIARLERSSELVERLHVVANDVGQMRGNRFVVPGAPADGRAQLMAPIEVSVRYTRPVAEALAIARTPVRYRDLRDRLLDRFPAASTTMLGTVLDGLIRENVLITSLRAPMTHTDGMDLLCAELESVDAAAISEIQALVRRLYAIRDEVVKADSYAGWTCRSELIERMTAVSDVTPVPLTGDTAVDSDVRVPAEVVREAEKAVEVLHRLTPHPFGYPHWRDYHRRFRTRYGAGAVVPVLDLVADSGLGFPAGYLGSAYERAPRQVSERDEKLLALIQRTLMDGREEILLDDATIAELEVGDQADALPAPRTEVAVEVRARSLEELARGRFRLAITGTPRPGSSMAGRFAHLLDAEDQSRLARTYGSGEASTEAAQLSFTPRRRRNENITRAPQLLPCVIPVGEHRGPGSEVIRLADLAVTADARRFRLVQMSTGRYVEPRVLHALEAGVHTPPLARFLAEITTARCSVYTAIDLGAAAHLPYLPRLRYGRTILAPARWLLTTDDVPGLAATTSVWDAGFAEWRKHLRVSERVTMVDDDQRLPLDLTHPVHRLLLRRRLNAVRRLELREAPDPAELGWIGRAHELLLPLTLAPGRRSSQAGDGVRAVRPAPPERVELPGRAGVLYARLHAHPARYDEILTEHLPELLRTVSASDAGRRWWYQRHRETSRPEADQYLDMYLRLPSADAYGRVAELVAAWAAHLRERKLLAGLTLATYEPQVGRYGHGLAMDAAEDVFSTDSAAALAQLQVVARSDTSSQALAAASMVNLVTCFATDPDEGLRWLVDCLPRRGRLDPDSRDAAFALTDPTAPETIASMPGGDGITGAWSDRGNALAAYSELLAVQREPMTVLRSLLHLHHTRALPVDPEVERRTLQLARACALRRAHTSRSGS